MPMIAHLRIRLRHERVAWIGHANVTVIDVVHRLAFGWNPEEIHFQDPHLLLAQIHAGCAHSYDHQALDVASPAL